MYIDPEILPILELIHSGDVDSEVVQTVEERRQGYSALLQMLGDGPAMVAIEDHQIAAANHELTARVYKPNSDASLPVLVYYHGGGWTIGDLDAYNELCRQLAHRIGCIVISVDYRLAPEHPFPAAVDDAVLALDWVHENAQQLGGDPHRLAVAGDSAGGNLATVAAIAARDSGTPALIFQLLLYPTVEIDLRETPSAVENAEGFILTAEVMRWFSDQYCPNPSDREDPRASPILSSNFSGLPPTHIVTASLDPLADQGAAYVHALDNAGSKVTHTHAEGLPHAFLHFHGQVAESERILQSLCDQACEAFL